MRAERAKMGVRGLAHGNFFVTMHFRSLENAPIMTNLLSKGAKDRDYWKAFQGKFENRTSKSHRNRLFLNRNVIA